MASRQGPNVCGATQQGIDGELRQVVQRFCHLTTDGWAFSASGTPPFRHEVSGLLYGAAVEAGRLQHAGRVEDVFGDGFAGIDEAYGGVGL